ncbi:hypothetical protein DAI22_08g205700 [Oryza sativa Japonica Group]|nr:hypothetical protein DAI22_08g205700 [Oryza sativa Japonica Group]
MEQRHQVLRWLLAKSTALAPALLPKPPVCASNGAPLLPQLGNPPHHPLRRPQAHLCTGHGVPVDKYRVPKTDHHPPTRLAVTAADMRGRRDGGARAGDHQDQRMLEPPPSAPQSGQAEAGHRGGEGCVGRAGVGRGGRRPPPFPLPAAPAFALLQEQAHAQGHPPRVKS